MSDSASLVVRVSQTGVDATTQSLNKLTSASDKADKSAAQLTTTSAAAGKATGGFGSKAQQAGYQIQDMVVQLQGGTSAFVAIGQQVPQFLGAFGPIGAITGTVVALGAAIGGVLYKSMGDATASSKDLKQATKDLNDIITEADDGVEVLTDRILKLAAANEVAARAEISLGIVRAKDVINAASDAIGEATKSVDGWTNTAGSMGRAVNQLDDLEAITKRFGITQMEAFDGTIPAAFQAKIEDLSVFMGTLGKEYGLTKQEALGFIQATDAFNKQRTPENAAALANQLAQIATTSQTVTPEFIKFTAEVGESARKMTDAKEKTDVLAQAQANLVGALQRSSAAMAGNSASLEGWVVGLENSVLRGADALKAKRDQTVQEINNNQQLSDEQQARALKAAEDLYKIELADLNKREALKDQKHGESMAKQDKRDANKEQREQEALKRSQDAAADYLARLQQDNMTERQLIDAHQAEKQAKIDEYRDLNLISAQEYAAALLAIEKKSAQDVIDLRTKEIDDYYGKMADQRKADIAMRKEDAAARQKTIDDGIDAQRNMTNDLKSVLGEQNEIYKASAIVTATIDTYKAATGAYAALAGVPVIGPYIAPIAAGAAITAGLANVAAIAGAREQGGGMRGGSAYQMAERGKAEVIVPAGNSRARTAEQMRSIMGQNGGSQIQGVTIVNNTTGRVDSATTEVDNEGMLRVIIDEHVSAALMMQDSPIAKARRQTAGQPGY